jgi:hypothetical protein
MSPAAFGQQPARPVEPFIEKRRAVADERRYRSAGHARRAATRLNEWTAPQPPQLVRLQVMSRYVLKFSNESRPALRKTMTQARYQSLMDAVSTVMWTTGTHAAGWQAEMEFLRSADGSAYVEAVIAELDAFRATLRDLGAGVATGTPPMV